MAAWPGSHIAGMDDRQRVRAQDADMPGAGRIFVLPLMAACCVSMAHAVTPVEPPLDTVVVTGSTEETRRRIQTFVSKVTRADGDLIGRWRNLICPMVAGLSDEQARFVALRLIEVQNKVRRRKVDDTPCDPNLFVIVTDEAEQVVESWRTGDPGMFRWKTREGVSRSNGTGPVRTWHNAIMEPSDGGPATCAGPMTGGGPLDGDVSKAPCFKLRPSRIESSAVENISAVVVLVDTRAAGNVTLAQLADYLAMVSLSQLDLSADIGGVNSILRLFAEPRPEALPTALTEWDYAFLNSLYHTRYAPMRQRGDIAARMTRELAPR
jgi:hypothetical protein